MTLNICRDPECGRLANVSQEKVKGKNAKTHVRKFEFAANLRLNFNPCALLKFAARECVFERVVCGFKGAPLKVQNDQSEKKHSNRDAFASALSALGAFLLIHIGINLAAKSVKSPSGRYTSLLFSAFRGLVTMQCCLVYRVLNFVLPIRWQHEWPLATFNGRAENVRVCPVIVAELERRDIQRHVLGADLVEATDNTALEDQPEAFNRIRVDRADNVLRGVALAGVA
jgi:hypothetical protein